MKSIHWLFTFISMWGAGAITTVITGIPQIMLAPAVVSVVIIAALGFNGAIHES